MITSKPPAPQPVRDYLSLNLTPDQELDFSPFSPSATTLDYRTLAPVSGESSASASRPGRFVEDMSPPSSAGGATLVQPNINPASVPTRTSSSHAVNGHGSPKKRSLRSVPEEENMLRQTRTSPSTEPLRAIDSDLIYQQSALWSPEKEKILFGPYDYMYGHPGKDIRAQLIAAFNVWLEVPEASLKIITKVVGMLHTASLLVDDVEDSSLLRRGVPVAHNIFGTAQTINSANYVYFIALRELSTLHNPRAIDIYTEELLNLHRGQGMDLFWRDTLTCPSEDDYLEMVGNKTGGLFRLAVKLMQAESKAHYDMVPLVNTIGLLFQILDDYQNLNSPVYSSNKGMCEDLTEGKFSFPVIHSIRTDPSNLVLINILKQKTDNVEVKKYAVAYMEKTGSFAYTRRVLRGLTKKAFSLIDELDADQQKGEGIRLILEKMKVEKSSHQRASSSA